MDDYQFISFIWGAAKFTSGNSPVSPKSISDYEKAEQLKDDYHFFACIHYISQVKTGPFAGKYLITVVLSCGSERKKVHGI